MRKFKKAIVIPPGNHYVSAISRQPNRSTIEVEKALKQHSNLVRALKNCGLDVIKLESDTNPDSCFIEDPLVVINDIAIVCRPKPLSRMTEVNQIEGELSTYLKTYFSEIHRIEPPGFIEGGNIIVTESELVIGRGKRTNQEGINQFKNYIKNCKIRVVNVPEDEIHLKSYCTYIGNNTIVLDPKRIDKKLFHNYRIIEVNKEERHCANCLGFNENVLIPDGCPITSRRIQKYGLKVQPLNIDEFRKADGSMTCLAVLI